MHNSRFPRLQLGSLLPLLTLILLAAPARAEIVKGPLGTKLDRDMNELAGYGYSGSVVVAQNGEVVLNKGYGLADRAHGTPFTSDTLFDIASISKQFTAAAVLRLEMQGKLKVEDPIKRFFPEAPPDKAAITLHQLLTHTAGLPETIGPEDEKLDRAGVPEADLRHPAGPAAGSQVPVLQRRLQPAGGGGGGRVGPLVRRISARRGVPAGRHAPHRLPPGRAGPPAPRARLQRGRRLGDLRSPSARARRRPVVEPAGERRHPHHHGRPLSLVRGAPGQLGALRGRAREVRAAVRP